MKNGEEAHRESIRGQIMRVNGQILRAGGGQNAQARRRSITERCVFR